MSRLPSAFLDRPIAHRGLHDAAAGVIENSAAAFRQAVEAGYGIELDLQLSADDEAIVFHDDTLERLTGAEGRVRERRAADIAALPLYGCAAGASAPTLGEVLALVAGRVPMLIEIKPQDEETGVGALERRVAELLAGYVGDVAVMSFDPRRIDWFRANAPSTPRGLAAKDFARDPEQAPEDSVVARALSELAHGDAVGADFVSYRVDHLPTPQTTLRRAEGRPVLCWTVRSPETEREARRHADNITFEGYRP